MFPILGGLYYWFPKLQPGRGAAVIARPCPDDRADLRALARLRTAYLGWLRASPSRWC